MLKSLQCLVDGSSYILRVKPITTFPQWEFHSNLHWQGTLFVCLLVFPLLLGVRLISWYRFKFFSCCLGQQAMHSFAFPFPAFCPILPIYSFDCYGIYSGIQLLCLTHVKLQGSVLWTVLHGHRSFTDLFWLSMYWMAACDMERESRFSPNSF